jgi:hypothetical protein
MYVGKYNRGNREYKNLSGNGTRKLGSVLGAKKNVWNVASDPAFRYEVVIPLSKISVRLFAAFATEVHSL